MSGWVVAWILWALAFCVIEGLAIWKGGVTLSGLVWYLRASPVVLYAVLGSAAVAIVVWLTYHLWLEHTFWPDLKRTWRDDGTLAAAVFALALLSSIWHRKMRA